VAGSPIHGEEDDDSQEPENLDSQSQDDSIIRICPFCSNPIVIAPEMPEWTSICRICSDNSNVELSDSILIGLQCCVKDCTLDQHSPCRSCKSCFCAKHADEHGDCGKKKTNLKTVIPNAAEETGVPETLLSEEDSTNIPQEGLIQENPTTAQQDLMTSQAILHSFLNTLTYASPGNNNIMSTN
jgi:hypothetical protein